MNQKFHHIARGILMQDEKILITRLKGRHAFLPGGHVEFGESVEKALKREFKEELDVDVSIEDFLGVIENYWISENTTHYEINHLFKVTSNDLNIHNNPLSKESHIAFQWVIANTDNVVKYNILPTKPLKILMNKLKQKEYSPSWISNF